MLHSVTYGQGRDLVLLHGWSAHSEIWQELLTVLALKYRVTVIDLPGHGQSQHHELTNLADCVALVLAVAPPRADWLGWSLGGLVAMEIAHRAPERVERLGLVTSSPCFVAQEDWPGLAPQMLQQFAKQCELSPVATGHKFLALQLQGLAQTKAFYTQLKKTLGTQKMPSSNALQAGLRLLATTDLRLTLATLTCQVMHLFSQFDAIVPVATYDKLRLLYPRQHHCVIPGASHVPFISHQRQFLQLVTTYYD